MARTPSKAEAGTPLVGSSRTRLGDSILKRLTQAAAVGLILLLALIVFDLATGGRRALAQYGLRFLTGSKWVATPGRELYQALPLIFGTIATSLIGLLLAVPVAIGLALFVTEVCPKPLRAPLAALSDTLAAIPSVVYGLWGVLILVPWMGKTVDPALAKSVGRIPVVGAIFHFHSGSGANYFTAGVILGVMILPIISAITREVLATVPRDLRDGAYALGATRYEVIRGVTLPYARSGIIGASMLGLGRALGETIAVTLVIGNAIGRVGTSLFDPGSTIPSIIASEFREATGVGLHRPALLSLALILVVISFGFSALARLLVRRTGGTRPRTGLARASA
jgi:phosphate transport system permease protein